MNVYDFIVKDGYGQDYHLSELQGKVTLIVNTASKCGLANQFEALEALYQDYKNQGLMVIGFPSDQFKQEYEDQNQIIEHCRLTYGVTFPMMEKIKVNGSDAEPLFDYMKAETKGVITSDIKWNFTKFLIDKNGKVISRYAPTTNPEDLRSDIERLL